MAEYNSAVKSWDATGGGYDQFIQLFPPDTPLVVNLQTAGLDKTNVSMQTAREAAAPPPSPSLRPAAGPQPRLSQRSSHRPLRVGHAH